MCITEKPTKMTAHIEPSYLHYGGGGGGGVGGYYNNI